MTTSTEELEAISQQVFAGPVPEETVWIKWDTKGGIDRIWKVPLDTHLILRGAPEIQGVEVKSSFKVRLNCWAGDEPDETPNLTVEGPGKVKVDPKRRIGSFCVERA